MIAVLGTCTTLACTTACWVCVIVSFALGGFFGLMTMAMVVAARDADDADARERRRLRDELDELDDKRDNGKGDGHA